MMTTDTRFKITKLITMTMTTLIWSKTTTTKIQGCKSSGGRYPSRLGIGNIMTYLLFHGQVYPLPKCAGDAWVLEKGGKCRRDPKDQTTCAWLQNLKPRV